MRTGLITLAILGTVGIGMAGTASAQTCPPGQLWQAGMCRAAPAAMAMPAPGRAAPPAGVGAGTAVRPNAAMTTAPAHAMAAPPAGVGAGTAAHPNATRTMTTTTTMHTGTSAGVVPAPTAGTMTAEKREVCPAGFMLYRGGCAPAQDYQSAIFK